MTGISSKANLSPLIPKVNFELLQCSNVSSPWGGVLGRYLKIRYDKQISKVIANQDISDASTSRPASSLSIQDSFPKGHFKDIRDHIREVSRVKGEISRTPEHVRGEKRTPFACSPRARSILKNLPKKITCACHAC